MVASLHPESGEHPDEVIREICGALVTPSNELTVKAVIERYDAWLRGHQHVVLAGRNSVSRAHVLSFFQRHQPKIDKHGQGSMYWPEDWVSIGNGKRARMRDVTDAQLVLWEGEIDKAHASTSAAYEAKKAYISSRRDVFGRYRTLDALERKEFGYVDLDIAPDDDHDEDMDIAP